jgi:beta-glucosidase
MPLPAGFRFGVSTAAYQVEGAVHEDGRGPSIWDTFSHEPGRVSDGSTGDVACDHYHRYAEDLDLMAELGVNAYRFSIAWPRIQPTGEGPANAAGLAFYDRLVDGLLERGIDPLATLFHWDLPQALQDAGGWTNRDTAARFGEYAELVGEALGDRVRLWITLNEPFIHFSLGHVLGIHAPGLTLQQDQLPIAHHLLGHGLAVSALRRTGSAPITLANNYSPVWPASDSEDDQVAATAYDTLQNRLFSDPILLGTYPPGVEALTTADIDGIVLEGDMQVISAPLDAWGVNYYNPTSVAAPGAETPGDAAPEAPVGRPGAQLPFAIKPLEGYPTTDFGWPVVPDGLRETLVMLRDRYEKLPPIWITESGCSYAAIDDTDRITYLDGHLGAVRAAIDEGVDVRAYCVWSLMDNFEWAEGYSQRFGLVHVDFETQQRTPRASFRWYQSIISSEK